MKAYEMPENMKIKEYDFTVIMAVYKVEQYLAEAVDSIIAQDIGFEDHIQLILVDDGSPDRSGEICDSYAEKYPENIFVLHKENGGVSSARNLGLKYVRGKYVNFMDSDDILSENTMTDVALYFDIWGDKTDIISIPFEFFERVTGRNIPHNRKFAGGSRVVDLMEEYNVFQFSLGAAFLRKEVIAEMHFDESLVLSEDAKELYKLFLKKPMLGLVDSATYYYRKRASAGSAVDNSIKNPTCYAHHMKRHYCFMVENYMEHMGFVPRFVQFAIMYDLQWKVRLSKIPDGILTDDEIQEYISLRRWLFSHIDDEVVWSMVDLTPAQKLYVMREKHNRDCSYRFDDGTIKFYYNDPLTEQDVTVFNLSNDIVAKYDLIEFRDGKLFIEGTVGVPAESGAKDSMILIKIKGRMIRCNVFERSAVFSCGTIIEKMLGFSIVIPLDKKVETYRISAFMTYDGHIVKLSKIQLGDYTPLTTMLKNSFYYADERAFTFKSGNLIAKLCGRKGLISRERALQKEIKNRGFFKAAKTNRLRTMVRLYRCFFKKPIWLISDRQNGADDNGEAFFHFIKKNKRIKSFFVIGKDHKRIGKKLGRTLTIGSFRHQFYSLVADRVISSQAENPTLRVVEFNINVIKDLYSPCRYVFLQHGITKDNISAYLNKPSKGISLFITAAENERASIATPDYGYSEDEVALTGFARFDRLYDNNKKIITVMPTWRSYLADKYDSKTGTWSPLPGIENSEFFEFYNSLLSNERLLSAAESKGYKIAFLPHPNLKNFMDFFKFDRNRVKLTTARSYRDMYAESSLILTDYSSAVFDFALLKKPIVYSQFDKETFFSGAHTFVKGYFEYERDAFGEVVYDVDSTIELLVDYINNGCKMKPKYSDRVDEFFAFGTSGNCQRIYDAIVKQKSINKK